VDGRYVGMRLDTIGVLIDLLDEEYQNQLFAGAAAAARRHGARVVGFTGGALDGPERLRFGMHRNFIYDLASTASLDALLISAGTLVNVIGPERLATWCRRFEPLPMCTLSVPLPGMPCVSSDSASGMRAALEALLGPGGFTRVVCLRGPIENPEADSRYDIYCATLQRCGLPVLPELVIVGDFVRSHAARAVRDLLARGVAFEAIMASNDLMALGAIDALEAHGLRVPDDVAVIGFDDTADGRFARVALSTVRQSIFGLGYAGVELLLDRIHGRPVPDRVTLPTELVTRQSCGLAGRDDGPESAINGPTLAVTVGQRRESLRRKLQRFSTEADALLEVFTRAVLQGSPEALAGGVLELVAHDYSLGGDTGGWSGAVSALEREVAAYAAQHAGLAAFGTELWSRLRVSIAELGERARAQRMLGMQRELQVLRRVGEGLLTTLDTEHIMALIARELPNLGLESCYMVLFDREGMSDSAELVLAWSADRPGAELLPRRIPTAQLIPGSIRIAERPGNLIVEPLYFEQEQLGFAVFEMGPTDGTVYETLREQASSAIKRARLVAELMRQTTLRERAEQEQLHKEVEIAMKLQTSILPKTFDVEGLELSAHMRPVSEVGGDYYDVVPAPQGCWLGIGDVAGHGLQAGLVMLMIQSMLAALVEREPNQAPSAVWRAMNVALCRNIRERLNQDEHATLTVLRYERSGRLTFSGAHEEMLVLRAATQQVELVPTPGMWVGIQPEDEVEDTELMLSDGDLLVLYTDGVIEARNTARKAFGIERLTRLIVDAGNEPAQRICERVFDAVLAWSPVPQDDVTVLVARHHAAREGARPHSH
jgi:sigma-B regulation protein RsbU (phosphoserine phosphatase)